MDKGDEGKGIIKNNSKGFVFIYLPEKTGLKWVLFLRRYMLGESKLPRSLFRTIKYVVFH